MYIRIFLLISFALISVLPIVNVIHLGIPQNNGIRKKVKALYCIDIIEAYSNKFLFFLGISTNPKDVIIGLDGWLFLGDKYANTVTEYRKGGDARLEKAKKIVNAQTAWKKYFLEKGVIDFKILIAPNKSTIYFEKVPGWAKSEGMSISKDLYGNGIYVNSIDQLIKAKSIERVYYKTDTHWNNYGSGIAFEQIMRALDPSEKFVYPRSRCVKTFTVTNFSNGDLANMLKIQNFVSDYSVITCKERQNHESFIYDYNSKDLIYQGKKALYNSMMPQPYVIHTPTALNQNKILWLTDSFGTSMESYMATTFSHILKKHWEGVVGTSRLKELVEDWKPDYVFYTVSERKSLSDAFLKLPPLLNN